ncbi:MAG: alpha-2-macroglobulin family protein [Gemmataceae bacterium]
MARTTPAEKDKASEARFDLPVATVAPGEYRVQLPPSVRLEPGQALDMLVSARKKSTFGTAAKSEVAKASGAVTVEGLVRLTAPVYVTHLTTDKPMYQPGETVWFRSLTLDRQTLTPPADEFRLKYTVTTPLGAVQDVARGTTMLLRAGDNKPIAGPDGKPVAGVGAGELPLEPDAAGGEYTLTVSEEQGRFPAVTRKFTVNRYQKPRLDKKLDFNRSSYGPGDEVQARVTARRADGGPVRDRPVDVTVNVDDRLVDRAGNPTGGPFRLTTDADGAVVVRFRLPRQIDRGQASVTVTFDDNGVVEPIVRPIPVVLKKLQVEFFPEGGELVAGLPAHVYFQARTPLGKPAQLAGVLLENGVELPARLETLHDDREPGVNQGQGKFAFTPKAGKRYEVRIDEPKGVEERKPLPAVRDDGVTLHVPGGVFAGDQPIRVHVHTTRPRAFLVGAYCRGRLLDTVHLEPGRTEAELRPAGGIGGVCRVTVFEELPGGGPQRALKPVAERLVYRVPRERLDVAVKPAQKRYVPGQKVELTVEATDEAKKPRPAIALMAVVDNSVVTMADEKTARAMPTHFLLTTEVRRADDLEYADFLLGTHPKAAASLDLLLGTQGWRRFAEQNPDEFRRRMQQGGAVPAPGLPGGGPGGAPAPDRQRDEEEAERLLVLSGQSGSRSTDLDQQRIDRVAEAYRRTEEAQVNRHEEAAEALQAAANDPEYKAAVTLLTGWHDWWQQACRTATPILAVLAALLALIALLTAVRNRPRGAWTFAGLAATCGLLLAVARLTPGLLPIPTADAPSAPQVAQLVVPAPKAAERNEPQQIDLMMAVPEDAARPMAMPGFGGGMGGLGMPGVGGPPAAAAPAMPPRPMAMARMAPGMPQGRARMNAFDFGAKGVGGPGMAKLDDGLQAMKKQNREAEMLGGRFQQERRRGDVLRQLDRREGVAGRRMAADRKAFGQARPNLDVAGGLAAKAPEMAPEPLVPLVVREYAHVHRPGESAAMRTDFTETVYWHPVLVLPDGKATVSFDLSDSVTSFQATAVVHTLDGRLGAATQRIESGLPFTLAAKVPQEVTAGDQLDIPVAITNNTPSPRGLTLKLDPPAGLERLAGKTEETFPVPAEGRARRTFRFRPTLVDGTASLWLEGKAEAFPADAVRETIRVVPDGFPIAGSASDLLETSATHKVTLPAWLPGTLRCQVDVYPSTLADLQKGLDGLLREPAGASSSRRRPITPTS